MNFARQHLITAVLGILLVSGIALPAAAQELKIGVVNVPVLLDRSPQTKAAMDALQEEFAPRQREFIAKQKELEDLTAKIQKDVAVMGETERRNAEKLQDYAQAQGYDLIVGDGVLFASTAVNITEEVLRAVEANFQTQSSR
jgi:outer membrane protein